MDCLMMITIKNIKTLDMMEHKRINKSVLVEGLGYCVEVLHICEDGSSYTSYTPIETLTKL
jgi:hypothetical protein